MIVDCHSCGATYNISDEKVRGRRVRVRCKNCQAAIIVDGEQLAAEDATRVYQPTFNPKQKTFDPKTYDSREESTRVMSPAGPEWREPGPNDWTVNLSDTEQRTMTLEEIVNGYNAGAVTADAFVWREGMADWLPLLAADEIRTAIEAGEATRVLSPASLRGAPRTEPSNFKPEPDSQIPASPPRGAARWNAARAAAEPQTDATVTYSAPSAPPRARSAAAPATSVEYAAPAPPPPPPLVAAPPLARPAAARVREDRPARSPDLFSGVDAAGSEEELLRSSSVPLEQYAARPTGARNESSVLFSLNTLKASVSAPRSSAPPRPSTPPAASAPNAAQLLGMNGGGALAGMDANAALFSAPAVEATPPQRQTTPPRARPPMNTTPPTMRGNTNRTVLLGAVVAAALVMATVAVLVLRGHAKPPRASEPTPTTEAPAEETPPARPVASTVLAAAPAPAPPPSAVPTAAVTAAPPPAAPAPAAPLPLAPAVAPKVAAPAPAAPKAAPAAKAAPSPADTGASTLEAALRPDKAETTAAPTPDLSGAKKVVLAEEPDETASSKELPNPGAAEPAPEPPKRPFDTGAAKAALQSAAGSVPSCKTADGPTGTGKVQVTFAPSGRATAANVIEGPFGGTSVGGCIARLFRAAKVPPFSGDPVTVSKSFTVE
jgi:predicted Zn finger-like uncharacterized protein